MTTISLDARIVSSPDIMSGEPRVEGRRIRVKDIVLWYEYLGMSADEISFTYDIEVKFYLDEHIPKTVAAGLRRRGVEAVSCMDAGKLGKKR